MNNLKKIIFIFLIFSFQKIIKTANDKSIDLESQSNNYILIQEKSDSSFNPPDNQTSSLSSLRMPSIQNFGKKINKKTFRSNNNQEENDTIINILQSDNIKEDNNLNKSCIIKQKSNLPYYNHRKTVDCSNNNSKFNNNNSNNSNNYKKPNVEISEESEKNSLFDILKNQNNNFFTKKILDDLESQNNENPNTNKIVYDNNENLCKKIVNFIFCKKKKRDLIKLNSTFTDQDNKNENNNQTYITIITTNTIDNQSF